MEEQPYHEVKIGTRTIFNYSIILTILLIGFSVFYYFVIFLPGKEKSQIVQQEAKEKDRQYKISLCLQQAYDMYRNRWNSACKLDGKKDDCTLPTSRSEVIEAFHKDLKDECYKRYPQ